ncbi:MULTISPECIES: flagellin N-terminal helical domain-containing protein [unclassified Acidovorax]|uniref:flagellin N-terminal helical domain-containing protein n=1 Tax=unclassified Acidovorax TaxID=2684926 RepID=UPI000B3FC8CF|nr:MULTISPECIES: flagellin [unclassified Acidovorax]
MAQFINTNLTSLNTQNQLNKSQAAQSTAMERLSSGLRINSAKDDAAGSSIVNRFTAQIKGLNQASRNANDGISLSKTAEGAIGEVNNSLQRLRELAVQSANGTNTGVDRKAIAAESKQLLEEINRVSSTANFNGSKLLDGSFKTQFQVGANSGETIGVSIGRLDTKTLGSAATAAVSTAQNASANALKDGDLFINGVGIGASLGAADTASSTSKETSAIAKAAAINAKSAQTGVTAQVNATEVGGTAMAANAQTGSVVINGVTINIATTSDLSASRQSVVAAINAKSKETGVTAEDTGLDSGGVKLTAADGRNVDIGTFTTVTAAGTGLAATSTNRGSFTLVSDKAITIAGSNAGDLKNSGLRAGSYDAQVASASGVAATAALATGTTTKIAAGDFSINGQLVGASLTSTDTASFNAKDSSAISRAAAINAISGKTGVTATANATEVAGGTAAMTVGATAGKLVINGVTTGTITTTATSTQAENRAAVVAEINKISAQTGVVAIDTNDDTKGVQLVAADGRNITVDAGAGTAGLLTAASTGLNGAFVGAADDNARTFTSSITLTSASEFTIDKGTNATAVLKNSLGMGAGTYGAGRSGQSLDTIDLSTQEGASAALTAIDNALATVDSARADQGAVQNRFDSVLSSLASSSANLTDARSRIQDADFAAETANLSKGQVLQQAGVAMLAQANQLPQNILSLLR